MAGEMIKRIGVAGIAIPLFVIILLLGGFPFFILMCAITALALWELYDMASIKGTHPARFAGEFFLLAIGCDVYFFQGNHLDVILVSALILMLIYGLFRRKDNPLLSISVTLFGVLYVSLLHSFTLLRNAKALSLDSRQGALLVLSIFIMIWICDTGAFLLGKACGKRKLFKRVSPNKTWEGAIAGLVSAMVTAIALRMFFLRFLALSDALIVGLIVGTLGQISDLVESLFKRDAGIKDSSGLLPGHGGVLDRFDSEILSGPVIYGYFLLKTLLS